jgi:calcineurin-like phosphoesterase family protein/GTPase-associated adaptor domain-containing protein
MCHRSERADTHRWWPTWTRPIGERVAITFVHLSDIHFTANDSGLARRNESLRIDLLNDIEATAPHLGPASGILVTGDIAFSGLPAEYDLARSWLDLVTAAAGAPPTAVQCVPGNHDVHREAVGLSGEATRDLLRDAPPNATDAVLDQLLAEPGPSILQPLRNYIDFSAEYRCEIGRNPYWQTDLDLDDTYTLSIRGITTVLASDRRDKRPNMVVGTTQVTLPRDRNDRIYLLMGHHPPDWWHDSDLALDCMRDRCSVFLCGHKHTQRIEQVDQMLRVTAGAVHPEEDPGWEPRYNWLRVSVDKSDARPRLRVQIWPRVFTRALNKFGPEAQNGGEEYAEYVMDLHIRRGAAGLGSDPDAEAPDDVAIESEWEEESPPAAVIRPPLITESGQAVPERDVVRSFLRLPYTAQIRILQSLDLLEDEDLYRQHAALASSALRRAQDRGLIDKLAAAVALEVQ